jgi:hypothetical protein
MVQFDSEPDPVREASMQLKVILHPYMIWKIKK